MTRGGSTLYEHAEPQEQGRLDAECPGELHRREVDRCVAHRVEGDGGPDPERRQHSKGGTACGGGWSEEKEEDDKSGHKRRNLRRPDRGVVQLEEPVIRSGREEQEVGEAVGPPLRHQSFSTYSTMRRRIASSGIRPYDAPRFSRTCSARLVAGIAHVTAGCEAMNFKSSCGHP